MSQSAVLGNADLLRLIGENFIGTQLPFILSFKAVRDALKPLNAPSGHQWIISKKKYFVSSVTLVEWAQSSGCEFSLVGLYYNLFIYAATIGSVDVLRWAHQKYPPDQYPCGVNEYVCNKAAENGHIEVLEYLRSLGTIVKWNGSACAHAVQGGHFHVLQWLREVLDPPCPWHYNTCSVAAYKGNLQILQWLRAQVPPCGWGDHTCCCAAGQGCLEVLKWLRSQEPPCPWDREDCCDEANNNNHYDVVEWILSQPE